MRKGRKNITVDEPLLKQICVGSAHGLVGGWESKLLFLLWFRLCLSVSNSLAVQQALHGVWIRQAIECLHERDGFAALLRLMVIPFVSTHCNAVIGSKALVPARWNELFSLAAEKLRKIHRVGPELLLLSKVDVGHSYRLLISAASASVDDRGSVVLPQAFSAPEYDPEWDFAYHGIGRNCDSSFSREHLHYRFIIGSSWSSGLWPIAIFFSQIFLRSFRSTPDRMPPGAEGGVCSRKIFAI